MSGDAPPPRPSSCRSDGLVVSVIDRDAGLAASLAPGALVACAPCFL